MSERYSRFLCGTGTLFMLVLATGCFPKVVETGAITNFTNYVADAKSRAEAEPVAEGSLWVSHGRRSDFFRDFKARDINDIVTIQVSETTAAKSSADAKNTKNTKISASVDNLLGIESKIKELPTLAGGKGSGTFEGTGTTSRSTTLETTLTARVVDVLPSGFMVVEGSREVRVNNENQTVYITGVIRPEDVSRGNVVASSRVGQMAVRVQGRGFVSQPLKPGWLYRILSGVLPF